MMGGGIDHPGGNISGPCGRVEPGPVLTINFKRLARAPKGKDQTSSNRCYLFNLDITRERNRG